MAGITLTRSEHLRKRLIEELPAHDWTITGAALAAGYSEAYAKTTLPRVVRNDTRFCKRMAEKRGEMLTKEGDEVERLVKSWRDIAYNKSAPRRDRLRAGELLGKYHGIFSETRVLETALGQRELDEGQREIAERAALLLYDTRELPDGTLAPLPPAQAAEHPPE